MRTRFINRSGDFLRQNAGAVGTALDNMASDIETLAKVKKVPVKRGHLQGSINAINKGQSGRRVEATAKYARFQEFGGNRKRRVRKYSKPGTGAHYLRDSGKEITRDFEKYVQRQTQRLRYVGKQKIERMW